jgi:hypothetical protein
MGKGGHARCARRRHGHLRTKDFARDIREYRQSVDSGG